MSDSPETLADRFDAKVAARLVLRHAPLLGACAAIGLTAGFSYDRMQVPEHTATARLEVAPNGTRVLQDLQLETGGESTLRIVATTKERLRSRILSERVASGLNTGTEARLLNETSTVRADATDIPAAAPNDLTELLEASQGERIARLGKVLRSGLNVQSVRGTNLLKLNFTHPEAELSAEIANAFSQAYVDMERQRLNDRARHTLDFIDEQLKAAGTDLKASEAELVRFVADARLTIGADGEPTQENGIGALRAALAQATTERIVAERRLAQLERDGAATLPSAFSHPGVQRASTKAAALRAEYRERRARMKPDFPLMISIQNRIVGFEREIARELKLLERSVRAEARQARDRERTLEAEIATLEGEMLVARKAAVGYSALKRRVDADRARYAKLAGKMSDVSVSSSLVEPQVRVVERATVPTAPSNANLLWHLLAGLVGGLALGAGTGLVRELMNDRFAEPAELTDEIGVPVVATVPKIGLGRLARAEANEASGLREAYRYMRAALTKGPLAGTGRIMLVAGVSKGTGASSAARRLALDLAAVERRVLLIDADFHAGRQHEALGLTNPAGLSDLLCRKGATDVAGCFGKVEGTTLTVLPTGPFRAEAGDRLASRRLERMLALLRRSFDVIVIDAAPVLSRSDATVLSSHADATLLVARSDLTTRSEAKAAMAHLQEAGAHVAGAVFTRYERRSFQRAMLARARSPFETLRELVPAPDAKPAPNAVHEMLSTAASAMAKRAA